MNSRLTYRLSFAAILIIIIFTGCEKEVTKHDLDTKILNYMAQYDLSSVSACVIKNNTIVWKGYYGYINREKQVEASEKSIYHIASISKLFIATAIMQLTEQERLNINEDINTYLPVSIRNPHFPDVSITARMLLTHTAGIAWPQTYPEALGIWEHFPPDEAPAPSEWIPQFLSPAGEYYNPNIWKNTKPGTFELYSNIGSNVLAYLVEQISGQNFRTYCKDNIFIPLGMMNTSYNYADLDLDQLAVLYKDNSFIQPLFDDRIYASGGLKTTMYDLSHFLMAYQNLGEYNGTRILKETTIEKMWEIQNPVTGRCLLWKKGMGDWFGHTGGMAGCATTAEIQPDQGLGLIIFTNKHNGIVYPGHDIHGLIRQKVDEFR